MDYISLNYHYGVCVKILENVILYPIHNYYDHTQRNLMVFHKNDISKLGNVIFDSINDMSTFWGGFEPMLNLISSNFVSFDQQCLEA